MYIMLGMKTLHTEPTTSCQIQSWTCAHINYSVIFPHFLFWLLRRLLNVFVYVWKPREWDVLAICIRWCWGAAKLRPTLTIWCKWARGVQLTGEREREQMFKTPAKGNNRRAKEKRSAKRPNSILRMWRKRQ